MKVFALIALFATAAFAQGTIPEVADAAGQFGTLLAAVSAADLAATLSGPGPFTVFAPTDDAFAALGQDAIDNLLLPENKQQLTDILLFHVVSGTVDSVAAEAAGSAASLQGGMLTFTSDAPGSLKVNDVTIIGANVRASNGIIHVIDQVLMPASGGDDDMNGDGMHGDDEDSSSSDDDDSSSSDDDDSSSSDDDDSSSSDDDDSSSDDMMAESPMAEDMGETFADVVADAEMKVEAALAAINAQMTREEIKAAKDALDAEVADLEARCSAAHGDSSSSDDDDDDDSSSKRKRSSSSDDDDDSTSYSGGSSTSDCRHDVNAVIRQGRKDITKVYWSERSSSSDDDDSSSSDDDDSSSS